MDKDTRKHASKESIESLMANMKLTLDSSYKELYKDKFLMMALSKGILDNQKHFDKDYVEKILRLHANICYANMCLCSQCRASLKSKQNVEKQYNIRRSVVTAHEMYKYLYGFNGKSTLWLEVEPLLQVKYPKECKSITDAAEAYKKEYVQETDRTLRNVTKHYSNNPEEFFRNIGKVTEQNVTERICALLAFLQPIHNILVKELEIGLGNLYLLTMSMPMPEQRLDLIGGETEDKIDALQKGIEHISDIVEGVMGKVANVKKFCEESGLDFCTTPEWEMLIDNNIGLHILFIYLDALITFRTFTWSETFAEQRLNLAYMIVSMHEGYKKLYGFDENKRSYSFWNRAIINTVLESGNEQLKMHMNELEAKLDMLAKSTILNDEQMIDAFTHNGMMKNGDEYVLSILNYFIRPIKKEEMVDLTAFIKVLKEVMEMEHAAMEIENQKSQEKSDATFQGIIDRLDEYKAISCEKAKSPKQRKEICAFFEELKKKTLDLKQKFYE